MQKSHIFRLIFLVFCMLVIISASSPALGVSGGKAGGGSITDNNLYDTESEEIEISTDNSGEEADYSEADTLFDQGVDLINQGNYGDSLDIFKTITTTYPEYWKGWAGMGFALGKLQRIDEAETAFSRAVELSPEEDQIYLWKGTMYGQYGRYKDALDEFFNGIAYNPYSSELNAGRAAAYNNLQEYTDALDASDMALKSNSTNDFAIYTKAYALWGLDRYTEAEDQITAAIDLSPDNNLYWILKYYILKDQGDTEEAEIAKSEALSLGYIL